MTIAAGFVCADGLVLAADAERSDSTDKWPQRRFFERSWPKYRVVVTGTGSVDLVRMAADHLARELDEDDELEDIWRRSEKVINRLSKKYLFCYAAGDARRPELQLLIAVITEDGESLLLRSDENRVAKVDGYGFVGAGSALAATLAAWLYGPRLTTEVVAGLAAQILYWVGQHTAECHGVSRVLRMRAQAPAEDPGTVVLDDFFWGLHALLGPILAGCLDERVTDVEFDDRLRWFEEQMSAVRQSLRQGEPIEVPRREPPRHE